MSSKAVSLPSSPLPPFLEDPKRGLHRYDPLKLRIWDEVRDRRLANPLASLVRLAPGSTGDAR